MKRILDQITSFVHQKISSSSPDKEKESQFIHMSKKDNTSRSSRSKKDGRRTDLIAIGNEPYNVPKDIEGTSTKKQAEGTKEPESPYSKKEYGQEPPPSDNSVSDGEEDDALVETDEESAPKSKAQARKRLQGKGNQATTIQRTKQMTLDGKSFVEDNTKTNAAKKLPVKKGAKTQNHIKTASKRKGGVEKDKNRADNDTEEEDVDEENVRESPVGKNIVTSAALRQVITGGQEYPVGGNVVPRQDDSSIKNNSLSTAKNRGTQFKFSLNHIYVVNN